MLYWEMLHALMHCERLEEALSQPLEQPVAASPGAPLAACQHQRALPPKQLAKVARCKDMFK